MKGHGIRVVEVDVVIFFDQRVHGERQAFGGWPTTTTIDGWSEALERERL